MTKNKTLPHIEKIDEYRYRIPKTGNMNTDGIIYADEEMMNDILTDDSIAQVANVACLPGIVGNSIAMPDIHWGYGFPIGGVAAFDVNEGVVSPGGVGYDINCGIRLLKSDIEKDELKKNTGRLLDVLFRNIPSGVGSHRKDLKLSRKEFEEMMEKGASWAIQRGLGDRDDLACIEAEGKIQGAEPDTISNKAFERGKDQLGTLGSGNHFVEVGIVSEIYNETVAYAMGLHKDTVTLMIHTGSRGLGHQVCDDSIVKMLDASRKYGIVLPDRQLCCAPIKSPEGQAYLSAMACAANFGFTNREIITHWVREAFLEVFRKSPRELNMKLVYDVAHNVAKMETHTVKGAQMKVCVHRKGATRAFPAHHAGVPSQYADIGQPVLVPGDMGRCSYVLVGSEKSLEDTFGSSCHGAGRVMSRNQAKKVAHGRSIYDELKARGILVKAASEGTLVEEIPEAYKNVSHVVEIVHGAGICTKVAKLKPLAVLKG
ncbi:MAG: RtcB family protein [Vulcanimicrobiota bacterium]